MSVELDPSAARVEELEALLQRTQSQLATTTERLTATSAKLATVVSERDNLRRAYRQLMEQFELLRRRIFVAKAERVDATQLELEFDAGSRRAVVDAAGSARRKARSRRALERRYGRRLRR